MFCNDDDAASAGGRRSADSLEYRRVQSKPPQILHGGLGFLITTNTLRPTYLSTDDAMNGVGHQLGSTSWRRDGSPSIDIPHTNLYSLRVFRVRVLFFIAVSILATSAGSADVFGPITFSPSAPTELDQIQATFTKTGSCAFNSSTIVAGTIVRTTVSAANCVLGPPPVETAETAVFGPLPPNTYTYELWFRYESDAPVLRAQTQLVVAAPPALVPTLSPVFLTVLVISLAVVAVVAVQRAG